MSTSTSRPKRMIEYILDYFEFLLDDHIVFLIFTAVFLLLGIMILISFFPWIIIAIVPLYIIIGFYSTISEFRARRNLDGEDS